jgi:hypothetical protein
MKTTAHFLRSTSVRAAQLVSLACCAAIATGGCGSSAGSAGAAQHHGKTTTSAAGTVACSSAMLRLRGGREGENSAGVHGDIEFTNTGSHPCTLRGVPTVTVVTAAGTRLPVRLVRSPAPTVSQVVLRPRKADAADLVVFWGNWCGARPGRLAVRVTLPGGGTVSGTFDGPPDYDAVPDCLSASHPSTLAVLDAYQAL